MNVSCARSPLGLFLAIPLLLCACSNKELVQYKARLDRGSCSQWNSGHTAIPVSVYDPEAVPAEVASHFSPQSLRIAHAIGVLPLLADHIHRTQVPTAERNLQQRVDLLEQRSLIAHHVDMASLEISAIASELDCEEERISQLAGYLKGLEDKKESQLTVAAIAVGALGTLVTGIHLADEGDSNIDGAGIGFGIAGALLGTAMLFTEKRTDFRHPRNAIGVIHAGSDPQGIFPPSVWYCLTQPVPGLSGGSTLRQDLVDRWKDEEDERNKGNRTDESLYFGDGGTYSTGQLETRAAMFDQHESAIKLVKQDLLQLVQELDALGR